MREFKVVVLGSGGVGKSALTVQFVSGCFIEKYAPNTYLSIFLVLLFLAPNLSNLMTIFFDNRYDPTIEDFYRKEIEVSVNWQSLALIS